MLNFPTGISDCHNMISTVINTATPTNEKVKFKYRSFKKLDIYAFNNDLLHVTPPECSETINSSNTNKQIQRIGVPRFRVLLRGLNFLNISQRSQSQQPFLFVFAPELGFSDDIFESRNRFSPNS